MSWFSLQIYKTSIGSNRDEPWRNDVALSHVWSARFSMQSVGLVSLMNPLLTSVMDFIHCAHCKTHINNTQLVLTYITRLGFCVLTGKKVLFTNKPIAASNAIACRLATPSDMECQQGRQIELAHSSRFVSPRNFGPSMDKNCSYISACTLIGTYHVIHEWQVLVIVRISVPLPKLHTLA